MTERPASLHETYGLALFSLPVLLVYAATQAGLSLCLGPEQRNLKLVIEPNLLMLGLILHVQWRRVAHSFLTHGLPRPWWVATADCLSFVITFWALGALVQAFLQQAGLI